MSMFGDPLSIGTRAAWWEQIEERFSIDAHPEGENYVLNTVHPIDLDGARAVGAELGIDVVEEGRTDETTTVRLARRGDGG
jgi:hypothetical protein